MVPGLKEPLLDEDAGERPPAFNPGSVERGVLSNDGGKPSAPAEAVRPAGFVPGISPNRFASDEELKNARYPPTSSCRDFPSRIGIGVSSQGSEANLLGVATGWQER